MPPTTITPVAAGRNYAEVPFVTVDDANGNDWINTGNEMVLIDNTANANAATVTFVTPNQSDENDISDRVVVVPATKFGRAGPWQKKEYNPPDNQTDITWSGTTISSCKVAIVSLKE